MSASCWKSFYVALQKTVELSRLPLPKDCCNRFQHPHDPECRRSSQKKWMDGGMDGWRDEMTIKMNKNDWISTVCQR